MRREEPSHPYRAVPHQCAYLEDRLRLVIQDQLIQDLPSLGSYDDQWMLCGIFLDLPQDAVTTLDDLRRRWPDYQSADAHLLYARALEAAGRSQEALDEYQALSAYYPGAEPRVRYGLLLNLLGRRDEARTLFADVVKQLRRAPKHVRKLQGEWIAIAERESRA